MTINGKFLHHAHPELRQVLLQDSTTVIPDIGVGDAVINGLTVAAGVKDVGGFHQTQVLGRVLYRGINRLGNLIDRHLILHQQPEDLDTVGMAEDAVDFRLRFSELFDVRGDQIYSP